MARQKIPTPKRQWHVRMFKQIGPREHGEIRVHPLHRGWVVNAHTYRDAVGLVGSFLDNGPDGEYAGWSLEADVLEFVSCDTHVAELY